MKYLFIVQGEGRGHLTQAITLEKLLVERGHSVVKMLVGRSPQRRIPSFFEKSVRADVEYFDSMNFVPSSDKRRPDMVKTILFNSIEIPRFIPSMQKIRDQIRSSNPDVVVNFYELMCGLSYFFYDINVPLVCIGHQYLFLHKDFGLPHYKYPGSLALDVFSKLTSAGACRYLALSFRDMPADSSHNIVAVPPLLRREVLEAEPVRGDYIHGYMLNMGFADEVKEWHKKHPDVELRFFWDNWEAEKVTVCDPNLVFYQLDDHEFLNQMAGCSAFATTAGFESICEAMYLGKPIMMIPAHIEQEINAFDAVRSGAGISTCSFDLSALIEFSRTYTPDESFRKWVDSAPERILMELENIR